MKTKIGQKKHCSYEFPYMSRKDSSIGITKVSVGFFWQNLQYIDITKVTFGFFLTELEIEIRICFCRFQVFFNHFLNQTVIGEKFEESVLIVQHLFADYF